ncbi:MAG TPA: hypothetical protein VG324_06545 [Blastocatellia bacterium]|nr:hypothetical protein [Blastocatellia bacterium]
MNTPTLSIIETGLVHCVTEPRWSHGLEGFDLGQSYKFEPCEDGKGRYCRVYTDRSFLNYYETCVEGVFAGYFEPVEVREAVKEGKGE